MVSIKDTKLCHKKELILLKIQAYFKVNPYL